MGGSVGILLPNIGFSFCPPLSCVLCMCYYFSGMSRAMCFVSTVYWCWWLRGYCLRSQFKQQIVEDGTGWTLTELCDILLDILCWMVLCGVSVIGVCVILAACTVDTAQSMLSSAWYRG